VPGATLLPLAQTTPLAPALPHPPVGPKSPGEVDTEASFADQVAAFERRTLLRAYALCGGNISRMARRLSMDRSSLYAKLRLYAIHTSRSG